MLRPCFGAGELSHVSTPQPRESADHTVLVLSRDGEPCGSPLTDASYLEDAYRLHDAFHLGYAAVVRSQRSVGSPAVL